MFRYVFENDAAIPDNCVSFLLFFLFGILFANLMNIDSGDSFFGKGETPCADEDPWGEDEKK